MAINKIIGMILLILVFACGWTWMDYQSALQAPAVIDHPVVVEIEKGDSFKQITDKLLAQNLAIRPFWFKVIAVQNKTVQKAQNRRIRVSRRLDHAGHINLVRTGKNQTLCHYLPGRLEF